MVNNYVNPYFNPYGNQYQNYQQQLTPNLPQQQVTKVNGENGARAFQLGANSSALLLDECGTIVWLVTSDGAGYKTVSPYDIAPHQMAKAPDYATLETRIARLEGIVNATGSDATTTKRKSVKSGTSGTDATDTEC